jgi:hypothetical protein
MVYRDVDHAFPLFIPGWQANVGAAARAQDLGTAELKVTTYLTNHGFHSSIGYGQVARNLTGSDSVLYRGSQL